MTTQTNHQINNIGYNISMDISNYDIFNIDNQTKEINEAFIKLMGELPSMQHHKKRKDNEDYERAFKEDMQRIKQIEDNDEYLAYKYVEELIEKLKNYSGEHKHLSKKCINDLEIKKEQILLKINPKKSIKQRKELI